MKRHRWRIAALLADGEDLGRDMILALRSLRDSFPGIELRFNRADVSGLDFAHSLKADGLLIRGWMADAVPHGLPAVILGSHSPTRPWVASDDSAIGVLAARTLRDLGHRHLAAATFSDVSPQFVRRNESFRSAAGPAWVGLGQLDSFDACLEWLASLPSPVGVFAVNDVLASRLAQAAEYLAIDLPGQLSLIGVDDDRQMCEAFSPCRLTSIRQDVPRMVRVALTTMLALLERTPLPARTSVMPAQVVLRDSTGPPHDADLVARALALIQELSASGLTVGELATRLGTTERTLRRRFLARLGRGPLETIRTARVTAASHLLRQGLRVGTVAERVGFTDAKRLCAAFRSVHHLSPGAWRRQHAD